MDRQTRLKYPFIQRTVALLILGRIYKRVFTLTGVIRYSYQKYYYIFPFKKKRSGNKVEKEPTFVLYQIRYSGLRIHVSIYHLYDLVIRIHHPLGTFCTLKIDPSMHPAKHNYYC